MAGPSLLRILNTLEHVGFVSRRLADGHYRISALARMGRKRDRYDRVAEAAAPVLDRLCQKVSWPSDLMVPAGDHMEIRESSRVRTPFSIYFMHDRIGTPVNWTLSAVGRAYRPEKERDRILALLRKSELPEDRLSTATCCSPYCSRRATVRWYRGAHETFMDNRYSRAHEWAFDGGRYFKDGRRP